jgi:hypothetical protein
MSLTDSLFLTTLTLCFVDEKTEYKSLVKRNFLQLHLTSDIFYRIHNENTELSNRFFCISDYKVFVINIIV